MIVGRVGGGTAIDVVKGIFVTVNDSPRGVLDGDLWVVDEGDGIDIDEELFVSPPMWVPMVVSGSVMWSHIPRSVAHGLSPTASISSIKSVVDIGADARSTTPTERCPSGDSLHALRDGVPAGVEVLTLSPTADGCPG